MKKTAIVLAAGQGVRFGRDTPKQFMLLHDRPVFTYALHAFREAFTDCNLILVIPEGAEQKVNRILETEGLASVRLIFGRDSRSGSVQAALESIENDGLIAIHDAVRPCIEPTLIRSLFEVAEKDGAAVPVVAVQEAIRTSQNQSLDRSTLFTVQTPQCFRSDIVKEAYASGLNDSAADDAEIVEKAGYLPTLVQGDITNIKITYPHDFMAAKAILHV